jgi:hypothetical protein
LIWVNVRSQHKASIFIWSIALDRLKRTVARYGQYLISPLKTTG